MIYGYNPAYFVAVFLNSLNPLHVYSTRLVRGVKAGTGRRLESLLLNLERYDALAWPHH